MRFEQAVIEGGPIALPGAKALLSQIEAGSSPSARGWTIVTSGKYIVSLLPPPPPSLTNASKFAYEKKNRNIRNENKFPASNVYTPQALARTGIQVPAAGYVTADDVERGKPEPDPYIAGAARLGVDPKNCTYPYPCVAVRERGVNMWCGWHAG